MIVFLIILLAAVSFILGALFMFLIGCGVMIEEFLYLTEKFGITEPDTRNEIYNEVSNYLTHEGVKKINSDIVALIKHILKLGK